MNFDLTKEELFELSEHYRQNADKLLEETGLISDLKKYGKVVFTGSYAGNLMMNGDIDLEVVKDIPYSTEEVFQVLKELYLKNKFRSYFIKGDWDDPRLGKEFPDGKYVGLKYRIGEEKWKVDIWFVSKEESQKRNINLNIAQMNLTEEQRETILAIKKYREDNQLAISGQEIYELVLNKGIISLKDFVALNKS